MKFREEKGLRARVIVANTSYDLENKLAALGRQYDLVDLQYSTTTENNGDIHYSALALVR